MGEIIKFYPENAAKDPDAVLEQAIGEYSHLLIIGYDKNGALSARSDLGVTAETALWLVECFKSNLMAGCYFSGDDDDD